MAEKENVKYISQEEWFNLSQAEKDKIISAVADMRKKSETADGSPIVLRNTFYIKYGKRIVDIIISGTALIVTLPVNAVIMAVTYFDVGKPLIFKQERIGKNEKSFYLCKFRNMTDATNERGELLPPSQRVTKWGKFVRSTSLDELLNFWSIFKGDMSVIGPRPMPKQYLDRFSRYHKQRHLVRPGLECPFHDSSLRGKGWQGRLDNDVWYVKNISVSTDIKMVGLLIKKVFSRMERSESADGTVGEFIGYDRDGKAMDEYRIPVEYLKFTKSESYIGGTK